MVVRDLYSKRRKRESGEVVDVFSYDAIPTALRNQVVHLWHEVIGVPGHVGGSSFSTKVRETYFQIVQALRREYGLSKLLSTVSDIYSAVHAHEELRAWFLTESDPERVIDAIELTSQIMLDVCSRFDYLHRRNSEDIAKGAINELNIRFRENGVGFQFTDGQIVRVDSQFIHAEAVVPALTLLRKPAFANAQSEFLSAYEHFRHGNKPEVLVDCLKAFESTMKVICDKHHWIYDEKATARDLVTVCLANGIIPAYWQSHFTGLRSVLESAIPTPRNRQGGHGAGSGPAVSIPDELVSYVLHLTASTILFLAEADNKMT